MAVAVEGMVMSKKTGHAQLIYRGSMPAPKYRHGELLQVGGSSMTIESRTWTGTTWCYSGMSDNGRSLLHRFE